MKFGWKKLAISHMTCLGIKGLNEHLQQEQCSYYLRWDVWAQLQTKDVLARLRILGGRVTRGILHNNETYLHILLNLKCCINIYFLVSCSVCCASLLCLKSLSMHAFLLKKRFLTVFRCEDALSITVLICQFFTLFLLLFKSGFKFCNFCILQFKTDIKFSHMQTITFVENKRKYILESFCTTSKWVRWLC